MDLDNLVTRTFRKFDAQVVSKTHRRRVALLVRPPARRSLLDLGTQRKVSRETPTKRFETYRKKMPATEAEWDDLVAEDEERYPLVVVEHVHAGVVYDEAAGSDIENEDINDD